jgi:hypothetical protein
MGLAGHVSPPHWPNANRTKVQRLSIRLKDLECCKAARYLFDMIFDLAAVEEVKSIVANLTRWTGSVPEITGRKIEKGPCKGTTNLLSPFHARDMP